MARTGDETWTEERSSDEGSTWSADAPAAPAPAERPTDRYAETGELLGQGGLGRVDAVRDRDLGREVARKRLLGDHPAARERFLREARVTSQLEHPGIVPVYELGRDEWGTPFYTMRRIRGRTLGEALHACAGLSDRLALLPAFAVACQAVAYAHARGVLHRDLKPDNVMVGEFGETLVVDWGLAKIAGDTNLEIDTSGMFPAAVPGSVGLTRMGAAMGTPAYMSPEQARGEGSKADARTDVWGLGAILFEILAGRPPFAGLPDDTAVDRLRRGEFEDVARHLRGAPPDLAAVVRKALMPDPDDRYPDAGALAADVLRWQKGGMVDAYQYSLREVAARMVRRNRRIFAVIGAALALLAGAGIWSYAAIRSERDRALVAESVAANRELDARGRLARSLTEASLSALGERDLLSAHVLALGALDIEESPLARGALIAASSEPLPTLLASDRVETGCALPREGVGGRLACWTDGGLAVWSDFPSGRRVFPVSVGFARDAWSLVWSPAGDRVAAVHYDGSTWVWDGGDAPPRKIDAGRGVAAVFLAPDLLAVATEDGEIGTVSPEGGPVAWSSRRSLVRYETLVPLADGRVAVSGVVEPVSLWDPASDAWETLDVGVSPMIAASHAGDRVAMGGGWGGGLAPIRVVDAEGARALEPAGAYIMLAASADGGRVAAADHRRVTVWDAPDWRIRARIPSDAHVTGLSLSEDGTRLVTSEGDGDVRLWELPPRAGPQPLDGGGTVWDVRFTDDGARLASAGNDGVLRAWDPAGPSVVAEHPITENGLGFFTLVGGDVLLNTNDAEMLRIGLEDGAVRWRVPFPGVIVSVEPTDDGGALLAGADGFVSRLAAGGETLWRTKAGEWAIGAFQIGEGVAATTGKELLTLDLATGEILTRAPQPYGAEVMLAEDDMWVVGGFGSPVVLGGREPPLSGGLEPRPLAGLQAGKVRALAIEGDLLAAATSDGRTCLWTRAGVLRACWPAHRASAWRIHFAPGGRHLASGGADGATRVWDLSLLDAPVERLLEEARTRWGLVPGDGQTVQIGR